MDIRTALKLTKGDVFAAALLAEGYKRSSSERAKEERAEEEERSRRVDKRVEQLKQLKNEELPGKARALLSRKRIEVGTTDETPEQYEQWLKEFVVQEEEPQVVVVQEEAPLKRARLEEEDAPLPGADDEEIVRLRRLLTKYVSETPGDYFFPLAKGLDWINYEEEWVSSEEGREGRTQLEVQNYTVVVVKPEGSSAASGSAADEDTRDPSPVVSDDTVPLGVYDEGGVEKEAVFFSADDEGSVEDLFRKDESLDVENLVDMHFHEQELGEAITELQELDAEMIDDVPEADQSDFFLTEEFERKVKEAEQWIAGKLENLWFYAMDKYQDVWNEGEAPELVFDFVQELDYEGYFEQWYPGWDGNVDKILLNRAMNRFWGFDNLERDAAVERFFGITEEEDFNPQNYQFERDYEAIRDSKNTNHPVVENLIKQLEQALGELDLAKVSGNAKYPSKAWFQNWNLFQKFRDQTGKLPGEKQDIALTPRTRVRVAQAVLHHWGIKDFNQYEVALQDIPKNSILEKFEESDEIRKELQRLESNWTLQKEPEFFKYAAALYRNLFFKTRRIGPLPRFEWADKTQRDLKIFELFRYIFSDLERNLDDDRTLDESEEGELEELQEFLKRKENEIFVVVLRQTEDEILDTKAARRERKRLRGEHRSIERRIKSFQTGFLLERMDQLGVFRDHSANEDRLVQKAWQFVYHRRSFLGLNEDRQIEQELDDIFGHQSAAEVLRQATKEERLDAEENAKSWEAEELKNYEEDLKDLYDAWEKGDDLIPPKVHKVLQELLRRAPTGVGFKYHQGSVYAKPPEDYSDFFPEKLSFAYWEEKVKKDFEKWIVAKIKLRKKTHAAEIDVSFRDRSYETLGPGKVRDLKGDEFATFAKYPRNKVPDNVRSYYRLENDVYYVSDNIEDLRKRRIQQWAVRFVFGYATKKREIKDRNPGEKLHKTAERLKQMEGYTKGWWSKNKSGIFRYLPIDIWKFTEWMDGIIEEMADKLHRKLK